MPSVSAGDWKTDDLTVWAQEQELEELVTKTHELQEVIVFERTNALLSRVSDKDSRIATLEEAGAKRHAIEIKELRKEREEDVRQLKEQVRAVCMLGCLVVLLGRNRHVCICLTVLQTVAV